MSWPTVNLTLRLRWLSTVSAALGLIAVLLAVGALFPAVGHTIGKLNIPKGVSDLLGGADYATITGWFRSEIGSIYGPLLIAAVAITGACATTAGEEEDRILALVLAHPVPRSRLVAAKATAIAGVVLIIALATSIGLIAGVALAGGGISLGHLAAFALQLAFFGFATGAIALAMAAGTGRRSFANGVAAGVAVVGWLINGFAPLVSALSLAQVPVAVLLLRRPRPAEQRRRPRRPRRPRSRDAGTDRGRARQLRRPRPARLEPENQPVPTILIELPGREGVVRLDDEAPTPWDRRARSGSAVSGWRQPRLVDQPQLWTGSAPSRSSLARRLAALIVRPPVMSAPLSPLSVRVVLKSIDGTVIEPVVGDREVLVKRCSTVLTS